jgi:hypothetical protein
LGLAYDRKEKIVKKINVLIIFTLFIGIILISGCSTAPQLPEGAMTPKELLDNPVYDVKVRVAGQVSGLGEFFCPCFLLSAGGSELEVWHGLMVEDDGTELPAVDVEGFENGDWVVVTGKLKPGGSNHSLNDFWASEIEWIP